MTNMEDLKTSPNNNSDQYNKGMKITYGTLDGKIETSSSASSSFQGYSKPTFLERIFPYGFFDEFKELQKLAWPIILIQFFQMFNGPLSMMFCGRIGKVEFDAVALAVSLINVTAISLATGVASSCDTLFSQTFGSIHKRRLGICLQRSLLVMSLAVLPCWAIHLNFEAILILCGQDPEVSKLAAEYLIIFMPGTLAIFLYMPLSKYIQNQNILIPCVVVGLLSILVNALLHYILVINLEMSTKGSAIAQMISYTSMFAFTLAYILGSRMYAETWDGWSWECLEDWGSFIKLAGFGTIMLCVEWWSFEIGIFLCGILGTTELGAQSVLFQLEGMAFMIPLGVAIATSIRVGQYLGAGNGSGAMTTSRVALLSITAMSIVVAILFATAKNYLPRIFTDVEDVVNLASSLLPIVAMYCIAENVAGTAAGVLRGCGRQMLGAIIICIGYAVALSAGIPLMFLTKLRVSGLWYAFAVGISIKSLSFAGIVLKTDWQKQVEQAQARIDAGAVVGGVVYEKMPEGKSGYAETESETDDARVGWSERIRILDDDRKTSVSHPVDPILRSPPGNRKRCYSATYQSMFEDPIPDPQKATNIKLRTLILKRSAIFLGMFGIFAVGLILKFVVQKPHPVCLPGNHGFYVNGTLLPCNSTVFHT